MGWNGMRCGAVRRGANRCGAVRIDVVRIINVVRRDAVTTTGIKGESTSEALEKHLKSTLKSTSNTSKTRQKAPQKHLMKKAPSCRLVTRIVWFPRVKCPVALSSVLNPN